MRLTKLTLKNFRGYSDTTIDFSDFTTLIGINDAGKSTIFEALDIFFGNSKIDSSDKNVNTDGDIELIGYFDELPTNITLETIPTSLSQEYLTLKNDNETEKLVLKQVYTGKSNALHEYLICSFPSDSKLEEIHTMKIKDLREIFQSEISGIDKRKSTEIRKKVLANAVKSGNSLVTLEIGLSKGKEDLKNISDAIHNNLPQYQLFKSDRDNTDSDSEIQEPIKAMINSALSQSEILQKLNEVEQDIEKEVEQITNNTLNKIQDMDETLASELVPQFNAPKWNTVFKFGLNTDSGISLNKRGSGVRRLILLNFFRAEAERKFNASQESEKMSNIIYAFEEPETSQHPKYQKMLIDSFKTMSESGNTQVMITTHSPSIAQIVPSDGIRLIKKDDSTATILDGKAAQTEVISQLGIFPNVKIYPDQIKRCVIVEGPSDVLFFEHIYEMMSTLSEDEKHRTAFISGGGNALVDLVNSNFLDHLNAKKILIVDGDEAGEHDKRAIESNDSKSDVAQLTLSKATVEFYLPYDDVEKHLKTSQQIKQLTTTKEQWESGKDEFKLNKSQKKILNRNHIYSNFDIKKLSQSNQEELNSIINRIDSF